MAEKNPENCYNNFYWWDGETSVQNDANLDPTIHFDADLDSDPDPNSTTWFRLSILMPIKIRIWILPHDLHTLEHPNYYNFYLRVAPVCNLSFSPVSWV